MYLYSIVQSHMCAVDDEGTPQGVRPQGVARSRQDHSDRLETKVSLLSNFSSVIGDWLVCIGCLLQGQGGQGIHRQTVRQGAIFSPAAGDLSRTDTAQVVAQVGILIGIFGAS